MKNLEMVSKHLYCLYSTWISRLAVFTICNMLKFCLYYIKKYPMMVAKLISKLLKWSFAASIWCLKLVSSIYTWYSWHQGVNYQNLNFSLIFKWLDTPASPPKCYMNLRIVKMDETHYYILVIFCLIYVCGCTKQYEPLLHRKLRKSVPFSLVFFFKHYGNNWFQKHRIVAFTLSIMLKNLVLTFVYYHTTLSKFRFSGFRGQKWPFLAYL